MRTSEIQFTRPSINFEKTWKNIFRIRDFFKLSNRDLITIFDYESEQNIFQQKYKGLLLPLGKLICFSKAVGIPLEKILVIEDTVITQFDEDYKDMSKIYRDNMAYNDIHQKILENSVKLRSEDGELYYDIFSAEEPSIDCDEEFDKLVQEILEERNGRMAEPEPFFDIPNIRTIVLQPDSGSLFKTPDGKPIDNTQIFGEIQLENPKTKKIEKYDLNVPGLKEWYDFYCAEFDFKNQTFPDLLYLDVTNWETKAIKLVQEMYKRLPDDVSIVILYPKGTQYYEYSVFGNGGLLVPNDPNFSL